MNLFFQDIPTILLWYFTITAIGWMFMPLSIRLFQGFYDRGYIFSKILGLLLLSYFVWLGASFHLTPFTQTTIFVVACLWLLIGAYISRHELALSTPEVPKKDQSVLTIKSLPFGFIVFEELLFLIALLFWAFIRGHEPSIHGLEKFMDYGFINSILNTPYFPPQDMWLAPAKSEQYTGGFFINYYYFGHYITAFLTKLTSIPAGFTYNLMLSTIFAWCFTGSFSIGFTLLKNRLKTARITGPILGGLLSGFLVTLAGNLHTIYVFTKGYPNETPEPFWKIMQLAWNTTYWYPNATRFIPNTIHEFPLYSWVVADLHGHVLDIPFVLLTLAILLSFFLTTEFRPLKTILIGFLCGVMYMTNAWDGLIYLVLSLGVVSITELLSHQSSFSHVSRIMYHVSKIFGKNKNPSQFFVKNIAIQIAIIIFSFILTTVPFSIHFKPFVSGFGVVGGWEIGHALGLIKDEPVAEGTQAVVKIGPFLLEKGNNLRSPVWMLGVLWGFFYFNVLVLLIYLFKASRFKFTEYRILNTDYWRKLFSRLHSTDIFCLLLVAISTLLLIFPEFFYAKDIYPGHYRANTMFKLGYQAYIMLSLVSAYAIMIVNHHFVQRRTKPLFFHLWKSVTIVLVLLVGIYSYFAIQSYYGPFSPVNRAYEGQDGVEWMQTSLPGDYAAIEFLKTQEKGVVLEGVGESYTDYARISSYTGFPTPLGWPVHEWLWRGSYDEAGARVEEIKQAYEATDPQVLKDVIDKYDIRYIVVGNLEREKYPGLNEEVIKQFSEPVFTEGETMVYEIN